MVYTEKEKVSSSDKEEGESVGRHDHGSKEEATEDKVTVDGGGSDT